MSNYDSEAARAAWAAAAHIPATALQASSLGKQFISICLYLKVRSMNQNKFKEYIKIPRKLQQFMVLKVDQTIMRNILIISTHFSLQQTVSKKFSFLLKISEFQPF